MAQNNALPVNEGFSYRAGQAAWSSQFDFSGNLTQYVSLDMQQLGLSCVRTIFIDNTGNDSALILTVPVVGQVIQVPSRAQVFSPVIQIGGVFQVTAVDNDIVGPSATIVPYTLLNYDMPPCTIYKPGMGGVVAPQSRNFTNIYSPTLTVAATSQIVEVTNKSRGRVIIQNPSTAALQGIATAESVFIAFAGTAVNNPIGAPSLELLAGAIFDTGIGPAPNAAIRFNAATVGHKITVWAA